MNAGKYFRKPGKFQGTPWVHRTGKQKRTCLGVKANGAYCNTTFDSLDAADRICPDCKLLNGKTSDYQHVQVQASRTSHQIHSTIGGSQ